MAAFAAGAKPGCPRTRSSLIEIRAVEKHDVPAVLALVADVLAEFGLEFGKGSPTDAELHGLPASYSERGGAFWTRARGGTRMVLDTVEQMAAAIAFYEANGFRRDDTQIRGTRCTRGYLRVIE